MEDIHDKTYKEIIALGYELNAGGHGYIYDRDGSRIDLTIFKTPDKKGMIRVGFKYDRAYTVEKA